MMPATGVAGSRLADIAGAAHVVSDPARLAVYEIDGKAPSAAVQPASREEISEIVKFCASEKLAVIPCGARSKLRMSGAPERYDVALDVARLDRIIAYDPDDLTLSIEPGIPLQRVAGVLAGHRQFLPLEVPFLSQTTAGGTIASGMHSPLRQSYGTARDFLLGLELVTGDGAHVKSGGRVVKNVAGYDLHKLMIGAMGTLGIITTINLRTFPAPASRRIFSTMFRSAEGALDLRSRVGQSHLRPLTMDILNPAAVEMLSSPVAARFEAGPAPVDRLPKDNWAFLATYAGSGAVAARYERQLQQEAEAAGCEGCEIFGDEESPASFGRVREFMPIALESSPATVILKTSVLPTQLPELLRAASEAALENAMRCAVTVGGHGVCHIALLPHAGNDDARSQAQKMASRLTDACARLRGNCTIPFSPAEWKRSLKIWGPDRGDFEQMRKLKNVFDPAGILSPGRFVA